VTAASPRLAATCRALDTALQQRGTAIQQLAAALGRIRVGALHDPEPGPEDEGDEPWCRTDRNTP